MILSLFTTFCPPIFWFDHPIFLTSLLRQWKLISFHHEADQGLPSPWGNDAFPPCFRFPLFPKKFLTRWEMSTILPFPEKFSDFHPPKFLMTFSLVIDHKFRISPSFPCFCTFLPLFHQNYYSLPTFTNSPCFWKIHVFFTCFLCISFPPTLTMMHLCITQCTYWTPLQQTHQRYL